MGGIWVWDLDTVSRHIMAEPDKVGHNNIDCKRAATDLLERVTFGNKARR